MPQLKPFVEMSYSPSLEPSLRNVSSLPRGTGAKFLLCLYVEDLAGLVLIAKQWCRKRPSGKPGEAVVTFGSLN